MTGRVSERTKRIWSMYTEGMSNRQIAEELGVNYSLVTSAVSRGRDAHVIPQLETSSPLWYGTELHLIKGTMGHVLNSLTRQQLVWLADNAHEWECNSLAEVVLEIVRDAHAEATKGQDDE